MGLLNALSGLGLGDKSLGENGTFGSRLQGLMSSPGFANSVSMMATGEPNFSGGFMPQQSMAPPQMGMTQSPPPQQGMPANAGPPMIPQMGGGMPGAFSGNPQFQQQLQMLMQGQGPGTQPVQYTPPQMPMSTQAPRPGGQQNMPPGSLLGMSGLNGRLW